MKVKQTEIKCHLKAWWSGMSEAEKYMKNVSDAIDRNIVDAQARIDIYNRAYEAVCAAIKDTRTESIKGGE